MYRIRDNDVQTPNVPEIILEFVYLQQRDWRSKLLQRIAYERNVIPERKTVLHSRGEILPLGWEKKEGKRKRLRGSCALCLSRCSLAGFLCFTWKCISILPVKRTRTEVLLSYISRTNLLSLQVHRWRIMHMTRCNDQMIARASIAFQFIAIYIHAEGRSASLNSQLQFLCALKLDKNERTARIGAKGCNSRYSC